MPWSLNIKRYEMNWAEIFVCMAFCLPTCALLCSLLDRRRNKRYEEMFKNLLEPTRKREYDRKTGKWI